MKTNTYIHFNGQLPRSDVLLSKGPRGELHLEAYTDGTGKPQADPKALLMHSQLTVAGTPLVMASDSSPDGQVKHGNNFSVSVECESLDEVERVYKAIGEKEKFGGH